MNKQITLIAIGLILLVGGVFAISTQAPNPNQEELIEIKEIIPTQETPIEITKEIIPYQEPTQESYLMALEEREITEINANYQEQVSNIQFEEIKLDSMEEILNG